MHELLTAWHKGEKDFMSRESAHFSHNIFYSYNTMIAVKNADTIYINTCKYSRTTTSQQTALYEFAHANGYKIVEVETDQALNHYRY